MPPHQNWKDTADKIEALAVRFQAGEFSETVYRASLYAKGLRGDDIDHIVRRQMEIYSNMKNDPILSTSVEELRRTINAQKVELASRNLRITGLEETLKDAERFMSYFAGETGGHFVGDGTPTTCLAKIRRMLPQS